MRSCKQQLMLQLPMLALRTPQTRWPAPEKASMLLDHSEAYTALDVKRCQLDSAAHCAGHLRPELPWFLQYRETLLRTLRFSDHETYDHPVASAPRLALKLDGM